MLTVHILSVLLFYSYVTSTVAEVLCHKWSGNRHLAPTTVADCHKALSMIPTGTITFDGVVRKPLHFTVPPNAREPKVLFPAEFRSGHCVIYVYPKRFMHHKPHSGRWPGRSPHDAASVLYFKVFPAVKKAAKEIIETCFPLEQTGFSDGVADLEIIPARWEEHAVTYHVQVHSLPPTAIHGHSHDMNVYQADKSGRIERFRRKKGFHRLLDKWYHRK